MAVACEPRLAGINTLANSMKHCINVREVVVARKKMDNNNK